MKPILLKGHERALTKVKYNKDGDLIFAAARDASPSVWYSSDGRWLGTYEGHNGAVTDLDITYDSSKLLTAAADFSTRIWNVETGHRYLPIYWRKLPKLVSFWRLLSRRVSSGL